MNNSTLRGEGICCATAPTPTVNLKLWISTLFLLMAAGFASAQSLSSDPGYHHLPTEQVKERGFFPSFPCPDAPEISEENWASENSTGVADFNMSDHFDFFGENPSGCTNTIWTGGYVGSTVNMHTSTQTVTIPDDAGIGLCVEYYSLLVDTENNDSGNDYSYIAVNGNEIFTLEHLSINDTETFLTTCLDISAYAGQEVELTVGNQVDGDNVHGNVLFGCFSFSCGEFTPNNDLCADAFPIACGESAIGNTSDASFDNVGFCGTSNTTNGVWYAFEGEGSLVTISACSEITNYDPKLTVFEGSCDELLCVTGNDDNLSCDVNWLHSLVSFVATPGQTYFILVHGFASSTGDFEITLTCEDACDPEILIACPEDANVECGADLSPEALGFPTIEANECVGEIEISFFDDQVSNDACPLILARTWIATDGETTELCTQTITITDNDAPEISEMPEDFTVDCSVAADMDGVLAYLDENVPFPTIEDCSGFDISTDYSFTSEGLDCPVVGVCTKTIIATDVCGNSSSATVVITIEDTEGPVLSDFESEILISCLEEVPAPEELTAVDACSGESSEVEVFTTNNGELTDTCNISTAFGPGDDWALWLPILANQSLTSSANFHFDANGGSFDQFNDGTAHMYGTLVNDVNANEVYVMDLWFQNKADWTAWSGLGRSYKDDLGCAQPDLYEDWTYYELVDGFSTLTGQDDLAGDILYLNHMPASYYFGFQIGMGANNKNCDYGLSGWFTYDGLVDGQVVNGHGDVNVDAECGPVNEQDCPHNTEFTYFYRAEDACGNATIEAQVIIVNDETAPEFTVFPEDMIVNCEDTPVAIGDVEAVDNCEGEVVILGPEETIIPGECDNEYIIERAWAAIDICGNRADMIQTITVIDDQAPELAGLPEAELTVECDSVPEAPEVTATDNCSDEINVILTYNEELLEGNCPGNYTLIRTWTATDECGNTSEFVQTINVQDTTGPVFNDYEFYTQVSCEDIDDYTLTATDNCGTATVEIIEEVLNSGGCMGVLYRVYLATDECGNTTEVEQYITITDYVAPILVNVPADATMECSDVSLGEGGLYFDQGDVVGEDNCGLDVEIIYSEEVLEDGDDCPESYLIVRTWVAIDYCENEAMAQQTITVEDTTAPEFVDFPQDFAIECSDELPEVIFPSAEDNCDDNVEIELTLDSAPGDCEGESTIYRIFRAFDNCGNETMMVQTISVEDNTAPEFTSVPDAISVECNTDIPLVLATAEDNCSEATITVEDGDALQGDCPQEYSFIRTFTATDDCGNSATATQEISIVDSTAPVFDAYEIEVFMPCDAVEENTLTATDNCGAVTITYEDTPVSGGCAGRIVRDILAVDECGNEATAQIIITLTDEVAPEFSAFPLDVTVQCNNVPAPSDLVDADDNCDDDVTIDYLGQEIIPGDCENSYTIIRTWIATDHCDNSTERSQVITVIDTAAPEFEVVADSQTLECDEELPAPFALAVDNCDENVEITVSPEIIPGECDNEYTMIRTYTATDNCGNSSTATQTLIIVDTTDPEFTSVPADITYECDEEVALVLAVAEDNCGGATVTSSDEVLEGECANESTIIRTFTATDACGNTATAQQIISIVDTTAPVFEPYDFEIFMPCDDITEPSLVANDNCGDVTYEYTDTPVSGGCAGRIIRDVYATDACGNTTWAQRIISLIDDVAPVFVGVPADMTYECDEFIPECNVEDVVVEDNCTAVTLSCSDEIVPGDCPQNYTILRTYVAEDNCDNTSSYTQTITVQDTTSPEFEVVADSQTLECDEELPAPFALAFDNCDENVEITVSPEIIPGECDNEYTMIRTYTATDNCGNSSTASQTLTIVDTTDPEFTSVPADITYECDEEVALVLAVAEDNCGDATVTSSDEVLEGQCVNESIIIRTFTATDACGNTATAEQIITIEDSTAPVFADFEIEIEMPCDNITETVVEATDNCGGVEISYNDTPVSGGCAGRIVRDWYAVDACGNESTIQQIITLTDNVAPVLSGVPADETIECGNDIPDPAQVTAEDNCDDDLTVEFAEEFVALDCGYQLIRTWSVTDHCDNTATDSQTISVVDTTAPVIDAEDSEITISCDQEILIVVDTANDACDDDVEITNTYEVIPGECSNEYSEVFVFTATDDCGNSSDVTIIVHHEDNTAPEFDSVPQDNELSCEEELPTDMATATDNCGEAIVSFVDEILEGQCPNNYIVVRHWTATDACGNTSTAETNYYIYDNTNPTIIGEVSDIEVQCADEVPAYPELTATDNCGEATISINEEVLEEDECGNYFSIVTITATDACFNQSSVSYTVSVLDETAPELTGAPASLVLDCEDEVPAPAEVTALDNCNGELEVDFTEELVGDLPTPGSDADCVLSTPAEYDGEGTTCDNNEPWSLRLFSFPGSEFYSNIEGQFVQFPDGTATLTGTVVSNDNPNAGWIIDVTFQDGMDWTSWSTQGFPTGYKDDCGLGADDYLDWTYYIMTAGSASLEGWGDYDGSFLNLTHAPSNYYYGYQVGTAANNVNDQYGNGGWFTYNGIFNEANVSGSGDFAFDMDCCPQYSIERTWTAEDCSGNSVSYTQTISFADLEPGIDGGGFDFAPALPEGKGETATARVDAYPNPAMDKSTIEFTLVKDSYVGVQVYNMSGALVADLFNAPVVAGQSKKVEFDATDLPVGIYLYRITTESEVIMDRIIIQK